MKKLTYLGGHTQYGPKDFASKQDRTAPGQSRLAISLRSQSDPVLQALGDRLVEIELRIADHFGILSDVHLDSEVADRPHAHTLAKCLSQVGLDESLANSIVAGGQEERAKSRQERHATIVQLEQQRRKVEALARNARSQPKSATEYLSHDLDWHLATPSD